MPPNQSNTGNLHFGTRVGAAGVRTAPPAASPPVGSLLDEIIKATEFRQSLLEQIVRNTQGGPSLEEIIANTEARDRARAAAAAESLSVRERALLPATARFGLARLFWWMSVAELAFLFLRWVQRTDTTPDTSTPGGGGPGPGDPGYVPPGWVQHAKNDPQYRDFPPGTTAGFQWWGWRFGHGEPNWFSSNKPFIQDFPWPTITFLPVTRFGRYTGYNPASAGAAYDCWFFDGVGPGSSSPPRFLFRVIPDEFPDAERIPETWPDLVPPYSPARRTLPRPGYLRGRIEGTGSLEEQGPQSGPAPEPRPRPRPSPSPPPVSEPPTDTETVVPPGGGPPYERPSTHVFRPPGRGRREVKLKAPLRGLVRSLVNIFTESADAITAIHKALPPRCRRARTWVDRGGNWHRARVDSMLRYLYNCAGHLDANKAIKNLLANVLQDTLIGVVNQYVNKATGPLGGRSGQAYGTRIKHAQDAAGGGDWTQPIVDAFRSGLDNFVPNSYPSVAAQSAGAPQLAPRKPRHRKVK